MTKWTFNFLGGLVVGAITWACGGLDDLLLGLIFFLITDWVTGMVAAAIKGEISSKQGILGLIKKCGSLLLVTVVYQADKALPGIHGWEAPLRDLVVCALIVNDFISVIENLGEWGVPIPKVITERLAQLKGEHA